MVADLVRPGSKRKFQDSDASFSSETTAVMEEEDLITFDYQHFDADAPSTKNQDGNGLNLVNLQFNALNVIGTLLDTTSCGKFLNLAHYFPYDVKLRLLAHSRSFFSQSKS